MSKKKVGIKGDPQETSSRFCLVKTSLFSTKSVLPLRKENNMFLFTVEPLLICHPRRNGSWPPNRGWYFHHRVDFLVNMESVKDNHDERHLPFAICHRLSQNKFNFRVLNFVWPFNRCKHNRKTLIGTTKRWLRPLNRDGWLIGVSFTLF